VLRSSTRLLHAVAHVAHGAWVAQRGLIQAPAAARHQRVRWWSGKMLRILGIEVEAPLGLTDAGPLLIVANHVSWLDILVLHALCPHARFVSKAGVRHWPLIGSLTLAAGTLFIERESKRDALRVVHHMAEALKAGDTLAVFPEGTTADGHALLPFHANLLQAALSAEVPVQPVALRYADEQASPSAAAAYVGTTTLASSLWSVVRARGLRVHVRVLPVLPIEGRDRRALAEAARAAIDAALVSQPRH